MNIYLSYKQSDIDKEKLEYELSLLKSKIEQYGHKLFVYYFEEDSSLAADKLNSKFLENIKKSDVVLGYINYPEKSEGQLIELGMAYSLGKKIKLIVNKGVKDNYYLVYGLGEVVYFDNFDNLNIDDILS